MKKIALLLLGTFLCAETIDCTKIFEERKSELLREIEKIDEARQLLKHFKPQRMSYLINKKWR